MVDQLDPDDALSIRESQRIMDVESVGADLAFTKTYLEFLPSSIKQLEEAGLPLTQALAILEGVKVKVSTIPGTKGKVFQDKLKNVLEKNPGLSVMQQAGQVLAGEGNSLPQGFGPFEVARLKYAPVVSVDVERSFSMHKSVLTEQRTRFTEENLEKTCVVQYYYAMKS